MTNIQQKQNQKGFTLIEMAIVVMIIGLAMAAIAQLYSQRIKYLEVEDTRSDIEQINEAIGGFLTINGRYPCPASLTAPANVNPAPGAPMYGRETDCDDGAMNTIVANGVVTTPDNIRIGAVPFKELNLDENQSIDGYRNRFIYAVTEAQAVQDTFNPNNGVITLLDNNGNVTTNNLSYVLYSLGENGVGAYSREGFQNQACNAVTNEGENCDFDDSVFIAAQKGTAQNANEYDDYISYNTLSDMPKWREEDTATDDINTTASGNIGVGPNANKAPEEELDVIGIVRAQDDIETTDVVEGKVKSSNICESKNIDDLTKKEITKCFPSALIGQEGAPHEDMKCPTGEFMIGIANGRAECTSSVAVQCPVGQLMIGINANGTPKCSEPIPGCENQSILVCGESKTLLAADHLDYRTLTAGASRVQKYRCQAGTWKYVSASGVCTCTPGEVYSYTNSCGVWSACGSRFTGTKVNTLSRICPSGKTTWTQDRSGCSCIESVKYSYPKCPTGFNGGSRKTERKHDCDTQKCSAAVEVSNTCSCTPETNTRWRDCPSGFSGKYKEERNFTCPDGSSNPGKLAPAWTEVEGFTKLDMCTCQESTTTRKESCPDGQYGDIATLVELKCIAPDQAPIKTETPIINEACKPIPPVQCSWKWLARNETIPLGDEPQGKLADTTSCDCETETSEKALCSKSSGSKFQYGLCQCEVVSSE